MSAASDGRTLVPAGVARGRAFSLLAAQRTWLAILGGQRLAHRPARTPPACGLAKSAFVGRCARPFGRQSAICCLSEPSLGGPHVDPAPFRVRRSFRPDLHLHPNRGVGWRWADLVRRGTPHPPVGRRGARDGWQLPHRPPLSRRQPDRCSRPTRAAGRRTARPEPHRSYNCSRPGDDLCVARRGRRKPDRGLCSSPRSGDLSCAMLRSGHAARWDKYWGKHRCD